MLAGRRRLRACACGVALAPARHHACSEAPLHRDAHCMGFKLSCAAVDNQGCRFKGVVCTCVGDDAHSSKDVRLCGVGGKARKTCTARDPLVFDAFMWLESCVAEPIV
jgi:hypothetical protein